MSSRTTIACRPAAPVAMRQLLVASIAIVGAITSASPLLAKSPAGRPDLAVGDTWVFRQRRTEGGHDVDRRWSLSIVERQPDALLRIERGNGAIEFYDESWNRRDPQLPEYRPLDLRTFSSGRRLLSAPEAWAIRSSSRSLPK
jgi:hypothetical protein